MDKTQILHTAEFHSKNQSLFQELLIAFNSQYEFIKLLYVFRVSFIY